MRRIIWNIITVLAIVNLIWLFVFNYKIPRIPSFSSGKQEEAVSTDDVVSEEPAPEEQADEIEEEETVELVAQVVTTFRPTLNSGVA